MMSDYFKGGRRKIGIVVLAFSLAFMGMWLRSISETDVVTIPIARLPLVIFVSRSGSFALTWADASPKHAFPGWNASPQPISFADCGYLFDFSGGKREWRGLGVFGTTIISLMAPLAQQTSTELTIETPISNAPSLEGDVTSPDSRAHDSTDPENSSQPSDPKLTEAVTLKQTDASVQTQFLFTPQSTNGYAITTSPTTGMIITGTQTSPTGLVPFTFALNPPTGTNFSLWAIPYWAVVTGLTLLAAYLLLSAPRATKLG